MPIILITMKPDSSVEPKAQEDKKKKEKAKMVSLITLYKFTSLWERLLLVFGVICALIAGCLQPLFVLFINDMYDTFGPDVPIDTVIDEMEKLTLYFLYIGIGLWVFSYFYMAVFGSIAENIG